MQATRRPTHPVPFAPPVVIGVWLVLIVGYVIGLIVLMDSATYGQWGAMLLAPVLIAAAVPAIARQARREGDRSLLRLLILALLLKLVGSVVRYYVAFNVYGGVADATQYHKWGVKIAGNFHALNFHTGLENFGDTNFIRLATGFLYTFIGPTRLGGFLFFSWLGFWGLFWFYRAFVLAVPDGRSRTYARMLFFLPSLMFWPSSIGKEAWMMFTLGLAALGVARLLRNELRRGIPAVVIGLVAAAVVRPHVAGLMGVAVAAAFLIRRPRVELRELAPLVKVGSVVLVLFMAAVLILKTDEFLKDSGVDTSFGIRSALYGIQYRTQQGGSEFTPSVMDSPVRAPAAVITVMFRPFLFEANNPQSLAAAIEGMVIFSMCALHWRWGLTALRRMRREPYLGFAAAYVVLFIIAFSSMANFGILARERVQLYPLVFVLFAVPPPDSRYAVTEVGSAEAS